MKTQINRKDWDTINEALACAYTAIDSPYFKEYHPNWLEKVESARKLIVGFDVKEGAQ